jgi:hypothetical protein
MAGNGPQIAAGGQISRFQVLSSFTVQDYEKAVNKASSPAGSNVLLWVVIHFSIVILMPVKQSKIFSGISVVLVSISPSVNNSFFVA